VEENEKVGKEKGWLELSRGPGFLITLLLGTVAKIYFLMGLGSPRKKVVPTRYQT